MSATRMSRAVRLRAREHRAESAAARCAAAAASASVVAVAKRDLDVGEVLDGEGGYAVRGQLMPAGDSLSSGSLPIGLAQGVELARAVKAGERVAWNDVVIDADNEAVRVRREMQSDFELL